MNLLVLFVGLFLMVGIVHNIKMGVEEHKKAYSAFMMENPKYFRMASFFCFLLMIWAFIVINFLANG